MPLFTAILSGKVAIAAIALGTLATGGTVAAAATGSLPSALQSSAHVLLGAPAPTGETSDPTAEPTADPTETPTPTDSPTPTATPAPHGPDATGPAAFGLCNAFTKGGLNSTSTAYASLAIAAGGAANITTYCATVPAHGKPVATTPTTHGKSGLAHVPSVHVKPTHPVHPIHPAPKP
jgi:hypothetical protein